jgi:hypothetical protein
MSGETTTKLRWLCFHRVAEQDRAGVNVVHRDIEEALDLVGVQIHHQQAVDAGDLEHVGHHLGADGHPRRARTPVLARVAEVRNGRGDATDRGPLERIDHDHQFHQVVVGRRAGRLQHDDILAADVLVDLGHDFAVGKTRNRGPPQGNAQMLDDRLRQPEIGIAREHHQVVWHQHRHANLRYEPSSPAGNESGAACAGVCRYVSADSSSSTGCAHRCM